MLEEGHLMIERIPLFKGLLNLGPFSEVPGVRASNYGLRGQFTPHSNHKRRPSESLSGQS